jgi:hypothetical protein
MEIHMENTKLVALDKDLSSIDFQPLMEYEKKIDHLANMNKMMASTYLRDFIVAADIASQNLARAIQLNIKAKAMLDSAEAVAYLDKATDFLNAKGIKDTAEARKRYVDVDRDVLSAKDIYAKSEAVVALLKNKYSSFRMAHDDCKKIAYGDEFRTGYEGM